MKKLAFERGHISCEYKSFVFCIYIKYHQLIADRYIISEQQTEDESWQKHADRSADDGNYSSFQCR